jgi:excisionase family DNA binding protein
LDKVTKLITAKEVAEIPCHTTKTVYNHVASNSIPHVRIGRLIRCEPKAIERWIRESMREP